MSQVCQDKWTKARDVQNTSRKYQHWKIFDTTVGKLIEQEKYILSQSSHFSHIYSPVLFSVATLQNMDIEFTQWLIFVRGKLLKGRPFAF